MIKFRKYKLTFIAPTIILILIFTCQLGYSQSDCVLFFKFTGIIKSDSLKIDKIFLPSTEYLIGYEKFEENGGFYFIDVDTITYSKDFVSHLSSDFCMDLEDIIKKVFKKVEKYPIRIITKKKDHIGNYIMYDTAIQTDQIKFGITKDKKIEIALPQIDLK